ncbi:transglycosylase SLT domain-containing protein [Streptomyces sp. SM11]|uniref:aggregation-promoting factor C-terminal-like domain-containing protein n=1 Tax=Streptomyces sp. SM11 TaxID=565557 RepID=UPI000CD4E656|nr:transglycosylase SLT domain-containing protein [Streptomyces sp. SM11]
MSRISVRGFAVASATAVTTVGAVVGVAAGGAPAADDNNFEAAAADTTLLADIPAGQQAQVQTASLTQQADAQASAADAAAKKSAEESARIQAAKDAKSKKQAAEDRVEAERKAAERAEKAKKEAAERASRSSTRDASSFSAQGSYSVADVKAMARQMVPADQFQCFSNIVNHESTWNYRAVNKTSGAYGLMQALPGHKMSSAGADWQTNPATQIKWGLSYMENRYGGPCGAWSFWQANNWY